MRNARGAQQFGNRGSKNFSFDLGSIPDPQAERERHLAEQRAEADKKYGRIAVALGDLTAANAAVRQAKVGGDDEMVAKATTARESLKKTAAETIRSCPLFSSKVTVDDRKREMTYLLGYIQDRVWERVLPIEALLALTHVVNENFSIDSSRKEGVDQWGLLRHARERLEIMRLALSAAERCEKTRGKMIDRKPGFRNGVRFLVQTAIPTCRDMAHEQARLSDVAEFERAQMMLVELSPRQWFEQRPQQADASEARVASSDASA